MATTRHKAESFIREMEKKKDELLAQYSFSPEDVKMTLSIVVEERVTYNSDN